MPEFKNLVAPSEGTAITRQPDGSLAVPDDPIIPFIEGDGIGRDIWRASVRVFDAAVKKTFGERKRVVWFEVSGRREGPGTGRGVAPDRHARSGQGVQGRDQGPADDSGRRRHSQPERIAAAVARPLRVRAPGAVLRRHPVAGAPSRADGRRHLPREHGGRLRRHRVEQGSPQVEQLLDYLSTELSASGSAATRGSGSSRSPSPAASAWCAWRSAMRSTTTARA